MALHSKARIFAIHLKIDLVFSSRLGVYAYPLWIILREGPSVVFQHKYLKYYNNKNLVFRYRYPKCYIKINLYWRGGEAEAQSSEGDKGVYPPEKFVFCKLCILDHSTVLRFLVVKSFIAASDDQLRISFIILQTSHFFSKSNYSWAPGEDMVPVTPVLNTLLLLVF